MTSDLQHHIRRQAAKTHEALRNHVDREHAKACTLTLHDAVQDMARKACLDPEHFTHQDAAKLRDAAQVAVNAADFIDKEYAKCP